MTTCLTVSCLSLPAKSPTPLCRRPGPARRGARKLPQEEEKEKEKEGIVCLQGRSSRHPLHRVRFFITFASMFIVIYRWRRKPGTETQFATAWAERTRAVVSQEGGLGSRLHRAADGLFVAYAQWPSRTAWETFMGTTAPPSPAGMLMGSCIESSETPLGLEVVCDLLGAPA